MFTGIITSQGIVKRVAASGENIVITLAISRLKISRGESMAVNGVCLTVVAISRGLSLTFPEYPAACCGDEWVLSKSFLRGLIPRRKVRDLFKVEVMPETLRLTTLRYLKKGDRVNIELPLRHGQRLGGHFVLGHIDASGKIISAWTGKKGTVVKVRFPRRFRRLVAAKGSITIDGVSLTVVSVGRDWFQVSLIPHTVKNTTLGKINVGDNVNIEFDIFARYIHAASR